MAEKPILYVADCLEWLRAYDGEDFAAIITDPPYGVAAMNESWDTFEPARYREWSAEWLSLALDAALPGAFAAVFGSPRMFGHQQVAAEKAGWQVRDCILWLHGRGFPKSAGILAGNPSCRCAEGPLRVPDNPQIGRMHSPSRRCGRCGEALRSSAVQGLGTALKPVYEPILLLRKPLDGTTDENWSRHGTSAFNIDEARTDDGLWPPDCAIDEALADDLGADARYFFCAKASVAEREAGCDSLPAVPVTDGRRTESDHPRLRTAARRNHHPTVKPLALMRWLVRLLAPKAGLVLDPFAGSGTTLAAAAMEGRRAVGVEREAKYAEIAAARIEHWRAVLPLD